MLLSKTEILKFKAIAKTSTGKGLKKCLVGTVFFFLYSLADASLHAKGCSDFPAHVCDVGLPQPCFLQDCSISTRI